MTNSFTNQELGAPSFSFISSTSSNLSPSQSTLLDHLNYSPTNTSSSSVEQVTSASTPESMLACQVPPESFTRISQSELSVSLPSPPTDADHPQPPARKTPKNSLCTYCNQAFTARGVKLHEQRCFRKREAEAAYVKETAIQDARNSALANKEMYESIIKQLSDEIASNRRALENTSHCLELSRQDHQIALEYADATAKSLSASREEVAHLRQCLQASHRQNKRSSEYTPGERGRKHPRSNDNAENLINHGRNPLADLAINRVGRN